MKLDKRIDSSSLWSFRFKLLPVLLILLRMTMDLSATAIEYLPRIGDVTFCEDLPKIECHAHLSGSIPYQTLFTLHSKAKAEGRPSLPEKCPHPSEYTDIKKFFHLFKEVIYPILSTPADIKEATISVLDSFKSDGCMYLELRTTPRNLPEEGYEGYMEAVHSGLQKYTDEEMMVRLILSINWDDTPKTVEKVIQLALKDPKVVGIDVCGDPRKSGEFKGLISGLTRAKNLGLKLTVHFAEIVDQEDQLESQLNLMNPDRLGHATFLTPEIRTDVINERRPIEICLSSNVKGKLVTSFDKHHLKWAIDHNVPVLISTDDNLVFQTSLTNEYSIALQILKGDRKKLISVLEEGISYAFCSEKDKVILKRKLRNFISNTMSKKG